MLKRAGSLVLDLIINLPKARRLISRLSAPCSLGVGSHVHGFDYNILLVIDHRS